MEKLRILVQGGDHSNQHATGYATARILDTVLRSGVQRSCPSDSLQSSYNLPATPRPDPRPRDLTPICKTICDSSLTLYNRVNAVRLPNTALMQIRELPGRF